ncbi:MAG TPA: hypothetical protein PKI37_01770 [Candidatus Cloacimonas sp.]|jgi:hypothetical protein|nr:hypothetical protein [Candidatus Cloacimonas sp.]
MLPEPILKWKSWPLVERPWTSLVLILFLLILSFLLYYIAVISWQQPFYYILGMLLVLGNLLPYFILTEYELYEDRVQVRYLFLKVSRPFSDFGCFYEDKRGIMLSTFTAPRRLDAFRGLSLRFSADKKEREQLIFILMQKIGKKY